MRLQDLYNELDQIAELIKNNSDIPDNFHVEIDEDTEDCLSFNCYKYFDESASEEWWGITYYQTKECKEIILMFLNEPTDFDEYLESQLTLTE